MQASEELEGRESLAVMAASGLQAETDDDDNSNGDPIGKGMSSSQSFMEQYTQVRRKKSWTISFFFSLSQLQLTTSLSLSLCPFQKGHFGRGHNLGLGPIETERGCQGAVEWQSEGTTCPPCQWSGNPDYPAKHEEDRQCAQLYPCE